MLNTLDIFRDRLDPSRQQLIIGEWLETDAPAIVEEVATGHASTREMGERITDDLLGFIGRKVQRMIEEHRIDLSRDQELARMDDEYDIHRDLELLEL